MLKICFAYLLVSANIRTCTLRVFMTLFLIIRFLYFKGSLTRDFSSSGFFHESVSPWPLSILLGPYRIFTKIRADIRNFVFIAGVNDTLYYRRCFCLHERAFNNYTNDQMGRDFMSRSLSRKKSLTIICLSEENAFCIRSEFV